MDEGREEDLGFREKDCYKNDPKVRTIDQEWCVDYKDFLNGPSKVPHECGYESLVPVTLRGL